MKDINYGFMGSGHFAARCLELLAGWRKPAWIATANPSQAGRGLKLRATPVEQLASSSLPDCKLFRSDAASKDDDIIAAARKSDFIFVIDFGQMIRQPLLSASLCLNIHPSLLPLYRGCAPVQRAMIDGHDETGVTVFRLVPAMDAGPILLQVKFPIGERDTSGDIFERAASDGVRAFVALAESTPIEDWKLSEQREEHTYAAKIEKSECRIDWTMGARAILNLIRGLQPHPAAYTTICGKRLKIISAHMASGKGAPGSLISCETTPVVACGDGAIEFEAVQQEGKKPQSACDWLNGSRLTPDEKFE